MRYIILAEAGLLIGLAMWWAVQLWHPVLSLGLVFVAYALGRVGVWCWENL